MLPGCGAFWGLFLRPFSLARRAAQWPEHPCTILSAQVDSHSSDDGTTYSPKIRYQYSLDGKDFESERYSFLKFSSGHKWAKRIVDQFKPGTNSVCYYDPDDPNTAVLNRDFSGRQFWFGMLFPWLFILVGGAVMFFSVFGRSFAKKSKAISGGAGLRASWSVGLKQRSSTMQVADGADDDEYEFAAFEGPQKLKPSESRLVKAIVIGIFCLIWNTFVGVFVITLAGGAHRHVVPLLFMIPFVLAGILLVALTIYQILAIFNPKVEIALSNGVVMPGESIDVAWQLYGNVRRLRGLTVFVEGTEKATYTRGTNTYTDTKIFKSIELAATDKQDEMAFGTHVLGIPRDTMHSFSSRHNKIIWTIHVKGDVPRWPDINEKFEFKVKPLSVRP